MKKFILLLCLLMLTACNNTTTRNATTQLNGISDPSYRGNFQTKKMVVLSFGMPVPERQTLEHTLAQSLVKYDIKILSGLDIFPPTRGYSEEDINKIVQSKEIYKIAENQGADTILIISSYDRDISEEYIAPTYHPGKSTKYVSVFENSTVVDTYETPAHTTGGYTISRPGMKVKVRLDSVKNKETIWMAEGSSGGGDFASFSDLAASVAETTIEKLSKEGLIALKKRR
ncbi:hypothetical protein [Bartonella sp. A05]|uniref:hypothetical protein n=1 Tax=Bartonella sp. A05 TaxID=2967261 RepID=UPI0022A91B92|nr:hypothetical protein [Bartonella sp. A05]MCZ2204437.1 hypothetical protein [Bartonella sp. A05]